MNIVRFLLPIIILISAVLGGVFFVFPKYQVFVSVQESIKEKEERIESGEGVLFGLRDLERKIAARQDDFDKLDAAIPEDSALPAVYHDLQRMGSESGLVLLIVDFSTEQFAENLNLTRTIISLGFAGSYDGIKNFLSQVKSSERMFNTQSITLEVENREEGILDLQVDIETYAAQTL